MRKLTANIPSGGAGSASQAAGRPVVVAMLTYRRLAELGDAVEAVLAQTKTVRPPAGLVVIDNDPVGGAAELVGRYADGGVRYVHEPAPGIAAARNRALREAPSDALLVFIDDDERPHPGWLDLLLAARVQYGCAAVVGPVVSVYDQEPDAWISAGRFFHRRRLATGTGLTVAATNNMLLDLRVIHRLGLRFDEAFGQSGGSDTLFTRSLAAAGEAMVWCDEAVVTDVVPVGRLTRKWVLARAFRSGNSWARTSLALAGGRRARSSVRVRLGIEGKVRVGGGSAQFLAGFLTGRIDLQARGLRTVSRGAGMAAGAFGLTYHEYRRSPERPGHDNADVDPPAG